MTTFILFVFGAIVGSFLNVVGLRFNSGLGLRGRSSCPHCGKQLHWWELLPVVGFFILKGRCSACSARISWQYPAVEILTGLIFATIFNLEFSIFNKVILILVFCIYVVIVIYDIRHKIIPDSLVYSSIVLSLIVPLFIVHYSLADWFAGPMLFLFFFAIWFLSKGKAMGFGDAKLALSVGLLLGITSSVSAIILAFWIGAAFGLLLMFFRRITPLLSGYNKITMKSEIPFAPFIVVGAYLALIFHLDLIHVSLF
ncbi:MAG: prepilin peptidase [Patescibacteria group bacterium]